MVRKSFILATREVEHPDTGVIIGSTDLRIHFRFYPGTPAVMYQRNGDPGWPAEPHEIEFDYAERLDGSKWLRIEASDDLAFWAESYLEGREDEALDRIDDDDADAAEFRAALREDT